jgi:hypothetical protein
MSCPVCRLHHVRENAECSGSGLASLARYHRRGHLVGADSRAIAVSGTVPLPIMVVLVVIETGRIRNTHNSQSVNVSRIMLHEHIPPFSRKLCTTVQPLPTFLFPGAKFSHRANECDGANSTDIIDRCTLYARMSHVIAEIAERAKCFMSERSSLQHAAPRVILATSRLVPEWTGLPPCCDFCNQSFSPITIVMQYYSDLLSVAHDDDAANDASFMRNG